MPYVIYKITRIATKITAPNTTIRAYGSIKNRYLNRKPIGNNKKLKASPTAEKNTRKRAFIEHKTIINDRVESMKC